MSGPQLHTVAREVAGLKLQVKDLQRTVGTLISWIAQSANSPIRIDEASTLMNILNGTEDLTRP